MEYRIYILRLKVDPPRADKHEAWPVLSIVPRFHFLQTLSNVDACQHGEYGVTRVFFNCK